MTRTLPDAAPPVSPRAAPPGLGRRAAPPEGAPHVPGYVVSELIGRGGAGAVWAATRVGDAAPVALKQLVPTADVSAGALREIHAMRGLDIPHVVRLHEVHALDEGTVLVLDLMQGGSLAAVLAARGTLSAGETVTVLTPILTALGRLHRLGVVHGDISPGNILFDLTGRPAIGDLGEARVAGATVEDPGASVGFVAPELLMGEPARPASDVYSVGALGVACLTGCPPPSPLIGQVPRVGPGPVPVTDPAARAVLELCEQAMAPHDVDRPDVDELAAAIFDAATAAPLRLVLEADPGALLTRRIREIAASGEHAATEPVVPRTRPARLSRGAGHGFGRMPRLRRPGPCDAPRLPGLDPRRALAFVGGCGLVVTLLVLVTLALTSVGATPPAARDGERAPQPAPRPAASATAPASPLLASTAGFDADPAVVVDALAAIRARLWSTPDAGDLAELDVPGSPAHLQDDADRRRRAGDGITLQGVRLDATQVRLVGGQGTTRTVQVVLDTSAHRQVIRGEAIPVVASRAAPILLELRRTEHGWRVWAVRPV